MSISNWTFDTNKRGPCYGTTTYTEAEDSGGGSLSQENSNAEIVYQVDDDQRRDFCDALIGYTTYGNGYELQRVLPQEHPEYPNFFCHAVKWRRYGAGGTTTVNSGGVEIANVGQWVFSKVTAEFRPLEYAIIADTDLPTITIGTNTVPDEKYRYTSRKYNTVIEYLTTEPAMYFYNDIPDGGTTFRPVKGAPSGVAVYVEKEMTWHQIPAKTYVANYCTGSAFGAIPALSEEYGETEVGGVRIDMTPPNQTLAQSLGGCSNSVCFDGHPKATVALVGYFPKLVRPYSSQGLYTWDITYRFLVRDMGLATDGSGGEAGVNYLYNLYRGRWNLITTSNTGSGNPIYPPADLNQLFTIQ